MENSDFDAAVSFTSPMTVTVEDRGGTIDVDVLSFGVRQDTFTITVLPDWWQIWGENGQLTVALDSAFAVSEIVEKVIVTDPNGNVTVMYVTIAEFVQQTDNLLLAQYPDASWGGFDAPYFYQATVSPLGPRVEQINGYTYEYTGEVFVHLVSYYIPPAGDFEFSNRFLVTTDDPEGQREAVWGEDWVNVYPTGLFTGESDVVDFNALTPAQLQLLNQDIYNALSGGDEVTLPDAARYQLSETVTWDPANWFDGGAGDDTIFGGDGADRIRGGADNDVLFGGGGDDELDGGLGNDSFQGVDPDNTSAIETGTNTIDGGDYGIGIVNSVDYGGDRTDYNVHFLLPGQNEGQGFGIEVRNKGDDSDRIINWTEINFDGVTITEASIAKAGVISFVLWSLRPGFEALKGFVGKLEEFLGTDGATKYPFATKFLKWFGIVAEFTDAAAEAAFHQDDWRTAIRVAIDHAVEVITNPIIEEASKRMKEAIDLLPDPTLKEQLKGYVDDGVRDLKSYIDDATNAIFDAAVDAAEVAADFDWNALWQDWMDLVEATLTDLYKEIPGFTDPATEFDDPHLEPEVPAPPVIESPGTGPSASPSIILGTVGDDLGYPGDGDDMFFGFEGNDIAIAASGNGDDLYDGGSGFDEIRFGSAQLPLLIDLTAGIAQGAEIGNDVVIGFESVVAGAGADRIIGSAVAEVLSGAGGNDVLSGRGGRDTLTGGAGTDSFRDTAAGLSGDTITDLAIGETIVITDANLAAFNFSMSGSTLTYSGGSLTLAGGVEGEFVASAASGGGVQLTLAQPGIARAKMLLTQTGQDFTIGGDVTIVGTTSGGEEIRVIRGDILLDASFNIGGDTVVLPGNAASYTAVLSGSFVTIAGGDISIAIPVGVNGLTVEFADAERSLRFDPGSGQVLLGTQPVTATGASVAAATTPFTGDGPDSGPASLAKLLLTEAGQDIDIGGNVTIVGTSGGGEVMTVLGGTIMLDASFNVGGDTVVLPGNAASYTATLSGSFVTIAGGGISVAIPVGVNGLDVQFSDATRSLRFDTSTGQVMLGTQVVTANAPVPDTVQLDGDFHVSADEALIVGYETVVLGSRRDEDLIDGHSYWLDLDDDNAPSIGDLLTIDGSALAIDSDADGPQVSEHLVLNASAVTAFNIRVIGGAASDFITLGEGDHHVSSGGALDLIYVGTSLTSGDTIDGGDGFDRLYTNGPLEDGDFTNVSSIFWLYLDSSAVLGVEAAEAGIGWVEDRSPGATTINLSGFDRAGDDWVIVEGLAGADTFILGAEPAVITYEQLGGAASSVATGQDTIVNFRSGTDVVYAQFVEAPEHSGLNFVGNFATTGAAQNALVANDGWLDIVFDQSTQTVWFDLDDNGNLDATDLSVLLPGVTALQPEDVWDGSIHYPASIYLGDETPIMPPPPPAGI